MKWNWDFFRGRKEPLAPPRPSAGKQIHINGAVHLIQGADLSDMEVAGRVRMLMRTDLGHEGVCTLARDRIVYLSDRLDEVLTITGEQFAEAMYAGEAAAVAEMGFCQASWADLDDESRKVYRILGAAAAALVGSGGPPAEEDPRAWFDRTAASSPYEEQRTRDGHHRHRPKASNAAWTDGKPPLARGAIGVGR